MIKVDAISKHFGGVRAIDNVSFEIKKGSITGLIGPNGAGKTTMFNAIAGLHKPTCGRILLDGEKVLHAEPAKGVLKEKKINILHNWPPYSPDLNPQEHVWPGAEKNERHPTNGTRSLPFNSVV